MLQEKKLMWSRQTTREELIFKLWEKWLTFQLSTSHHKKHSNDKREVTKERNGLKRNKK